MDMDTVWDSCKGIKYDDWSYDSWDYHHDYDNGCDMTDHDVCYDILYGVGMI